MPRKSHGPSIKDPELYACLRKQGDSKEKAARISNQAAMEGRRSVGRRGARSADYDDRTVAELRKRAAQIGIEGRSKMNKRELIRALRKH